MNDAKASAFAKGADVGWLPQMEATGYRFYNDSGVQQDCLQILKDHGINSIRLRTWVNPSTDPVNGHCSRDETVAMAVRAISMGFRIMINFHYSDIWCDPNIQNPPAAWANATFSQLLTYQYDYTYDVMNTLKDSGVTPEWVQIGNETNSGLMSPFGSTSNFSQLAQLYTNGYKAVKAVSSSSKAVIHLASDCTDNVFLRSYFDNLASYNTKYDVIGFSYYPYWLGGDYRTTIDGLGCNLNDMASRYGKQVMVCETGGLDSNPADTYNMIKAVNDKVQGVLDGNGLGTFYWEPQGAASWSGYNLSAWGADGRPSAAMDAFMDSSL